MIEIPSKSEITRLMDERLRYWRNHLDNKLSKFKKEVLDEIREELKNEKRNSP